MALSPAQRERIRLAEQSDMVRNAELHKTTARPIYALSIAEEVLYRIECSLTFKRREENIHSVY